MKTILLLFVTIFLCTSIFASDEPVDLKIEIDKPIEVKSGHDSSLIQMWVSIGCAVITVLGTILVAKSSHHTALKTIEKQSEKTFDLQNRQHALDVLRECIVNYLSIISKTILTARSEKLRIPDESYTAIITTQTNLVLMLNPEKDEELIKEIKILSAKACSYELSDIENAPDQYVKVQNLLRTKLNQKWNKIKGIQ